MSSSGRSGQPPGLPAPRGAFSRYLIEGLAAEPPLRPPAPPGRPDHEDLQLSLYLCYELHYQGLPEVSDDWEWDPSLLGFRQNLEQWFWEDLSAGLDLPAVAPGWDRPAVERELKSLAAEGDPRRPSLSRYLSRHASPDQFREFLIHRSMYQLKEADPHTWAIPRLSGAAKAALVEIQSDEYGSGAAERMHSVLFAKTMRGLGLDDSYGAYLELVPGATLATVNLMSWFGLHRSRRGALVGHLALFEMTSAVPNRRYASGLRRLGYGAEATDFFDEHVVADSVHELIAVNDLAGPMVEEGLGRDVVLGARALAHLEGAFASRLLECWNAGISSLRAPEPGEVPRFA